MGLQPVRNVKGSGRPQGASRGYMRMARCGCYHALVIYGCFATPAWLAILRRSRGCLRRSEPPQWDFGPSGTREAAGDTRESRGTTCGCQAGATIPSVVYGTTPRWFWVFDVIRRPPVAATPPKPERGVSEALNPHSGPEAHRLGGRPSEVPRRAEGIPPVVSAG